MASFRTRPLDLATEADFGALGRLTRQDYDYFNLHLLAVASLTLARCLITVLFNRPKQTFPALTIIDHQNEKRPRLTQVVKTLVNKGLNFRLMT